MAGTAARLAGLSLSFATHRSDDSQVAGRQRSIDRQHQATANGVTGKLSWTLISAARMAE